MRPLTRLTGGTLAAAAAVLAMLVPAAAAAPPNDWPVAAGAFEPYVAQNGTPTRELHAVAELAEATPETGLVPCLGPLSFARTVWYRVPPSPVARELAVEATGRTLGVVDLAAFVQPAGEGSPDVRTPNVCAGWGAGGADAAEETASAVSLRLPPNRAVLVEVGRRGAAGSPDDERAFVSYTEAQLGSSLAPRGDRAGRATPRIPRSGRTTVALGGATTTEEDPATPTCPSLGGVWRRITPKRAGRYTITASGAEVGALAVFKGSRPRARAFVDCIDRDGLGALALPIKARARQQLWIRVGTDRPPFGATARLRFATAAPGDVATGGGCLASPRPAVSGRLAARLATVRARMRSQYVPLAMRVRRGPVCAALLSLTGPRDRLYAVAHVPAIRGRGQVVRLRRTRRLVRGRYHLRVEAVGLAGIRMAVPSTLSFTLRAR